MRWEYTEQGWTIGEGSLVIIGDEDIILTPQQVPSKFIIMSPQLTSEGVGSQICFDGCEDTEVLGSF